MEHSSTATRAHQPPWPHSQAPFRLMEANSGPFLEVLGGQVSTRVFPQTQVHSNICQLMMQSASSGIWAHMMNWLNGPFQCLPDCPSLSNQPTTFGILLAGVHLVIQALPFSLR